MNTLEHKTDYDNGARLLKALAHPTRLHIIGLIREHESCVKMMEEILGLAQPNISQHLTMLRHLDIVEAKREGNQVCYRIKDPRVVRLLEILTD